MLHILHMMNGKSVANCFIIFVSYSLNNSMLAQLTDDVRAQFPVILTWKYACDISVVMLLRSRMLGNSPTALRNRIMEVYSEEWLKRNMVFMTHCCRHRYCYFIIHLICNYSLCILGALERDLGCHYLYTQNQCK